MNRLMMKNSLLMMFMAFSLWTLGQRNENTMYVAEYTPNIYMEAKRTLPENFPSAFANNARSKFRTPQRADEPIWRPLKYNFYYKNELMSYGEIMYKTDGYLHTEKDFAPDGTLRFIAEYNNTYTQEGWEIGDTITYFKQVQGQLIPERRQYRNYHYYDCLQEGCYFWEQYFQIWDNSKNEWVFTKREYECYRDTILFEFEGYRFDVFQNGDWIIKESVMSPMTCCNDDGFETGYLCVVYDTDLEEYVVRYIFKFTEWYPDGSAKECWHYWVQSDGTLQLWVKSSDVIWTEWHGSGGWSSINKSGGNYEYRTIGKVRNKRHYGMGWNYSQETGEFTKAIHNKKIWDVDGTETNIDSIFLYKNDEPYISIIDIHQYDDHGNYIAMHQTTFTEPDNQGNQKIRIGITEYKHRYQEVYDEVESVEWWIIVFENNKWDSTHWFTYEYYDWWDVRYPVSITDPDAATAATLSIVPNPVSGLVTISTTTEMQQLEIFDITGRLAHSQSPANKQVVFDTGALATGVYLVRAMMKDGGQRTGKVMVR